MKSEQSTLMLGYELTSEHEHGLNPMFWNGDYELILALEERVDA